MKKPSVNLKRPAAVRESEPVAPKQKAKSERGPESQRGPESERESKGKGEGGRESKS